ncbi:hypothetical protein TNCV_523441 [Trichonephila clavipes]|nr:hypothetical protein TNCV_523441 [Trichonephila clavipes]
MLFPEKTGNFGGYVNCLHGMTIVHIQAFAYDYTPSLLMHSKGGSRLSWYVGLVNGGAYFCVGAPGPQEVLRRPFVA